MIPRNYYLIRFLILFTIFLEGCWLSSSFREDYIDSKLNKPKAPLIAEVLMHLQLDYLKQKKLDPQILLRGALTELERMVPEVWVFQEFNEGDNTQNLRIVLGMETTILPISKLDGLLELQNVLQRLLNLLWERNLELSKLQIERMFVRGILNRLDGYSVLLPSEIYRDFNINIDGHFAGVGLVVGMRDGYLTVISPMDEGPAARAGLQPLDRIIAVDKEKTENLTLEEILHRLRGNLGTTVNLSVIRKGNTNALNFSLVREEIKVESVEKFDLVSAGNTFRFIRIKNFQKGTSKEIKNKIDDLSGINGLILDLRNNPGGLLEEAVRISDLFLPGKLRIVSTEGPSVSKIYESKKLFSGEILEKIPLVVLINQGSASASEIVAASLKQNGRAILIGEKSFGKGTVQTIWDLKDGSGLKLTIGEYLTPSGNSIHNIGVKPSLILIPIYISEDINNFEKGVSKNVKYRGLTRFRFLDENEFIKNDRSLKTHKINYLKNNKKNFKFSEIINDKSYIEKLNSDIFIKSAMRALQYWYPEKTNSNLKNIFSEFEFEQSKKIFRKLADLGVDWSLNDLTKKPSPNDFDFSWESEKISDEILRIKLKIHNVGDLAANRLIAVTKASNVLLDGLEFPIGEILPGETRFQQINVKYNIGIMKETEPVEMILFDQNIDRLKTVRKNLNFSPKINPSFRFSFKIFDNGDFGSNGNGDSKIQKGETIALSFKLVNMAKKVFPEFLVKIRGSEGELRINRGKIIMKNLTPGAVKNDFFLFKPLTDSKNLGKIKLEVVDTRSGDSIIFRKWNLNEDFSDQEEITPIINFLKLNDKYGNLLKGETKINSVILNGKIRDSSNLRDVFVHLNDKKVFYSANVEQVEKIDDNLLKKTEFNFMTEMKLETGKNEISVFARNFQGTISERKLGIFLRE